MAIITFRPLSPSIRLRGTAFTVNDDVDRNIPLAKSLPEQLIVALRDCYLNLRHEIMTAIVSTVRKKIIVDYDSVGLIFDGEFSSGNTIISDK